MKKIKVLNLYAGIGGNRKLWKNVDVTAVEKDENIANIYKKFFPEDNIIVGDAIEYLEKHFQEFDFIWASPPCPSHTRMNRVNAGVRYKGKRKMSINIPDFTLYSIVVFLQNLFRGKFVVENVVPYYEPIIKPTIMLHRHNFWTNFQIENKDLEIGTFYNMNNHKNDKCPELCQFLNIDFEEYKKNNFNDVTMKKSLKNCVHPLLGQYIFNSAYPKLLSVSPTSQTSPKGDFSNEKEHNISLKDNSNELSQISSNDETSLNNNIHRLRPNFEIGSLVGRNLK
jgi:DNA (cytosine-5)-methyltransferase 1